MYKVRNDVLLIYLKIRFKRPIACIALFVALLHRIDTSRSWLIHTPGSCFLVINDKSSLLPRWYEVGRLLPNTHIVQISYKLNVYCVCVCVFACKRIALLATAYKHIHLINYTFICTYMMSVRINLQRLVKGLHLGKMIYGVWRWQLKTGRISTFLIQYSTVQFWETQAGLKNFYCFTHWIYSRFHPPL